MFENVRDYGSSDLIEMLRRQRPELLSQFELGTTVPSLNTMTGQKAASPHMAMNLLEGTTILAAKYKDGVVMAGDRQASEGFQVGERRIQKVFEVDADSAVAIAGVAGPAVQMVEIFRVQVEFYEKMEGVMLSLEGKANFLSNMVRQNLGMALQGLVVIPIFAGYDVGQQQGRIFKYDATGGRYEENDYYATGSGGKDARSTLKKIYRPGMTQSEVIPAVIEALWDAADEDVFTGGPDLIREIYPTIKVIDQSGVSDIPDDEIRTLCNQLIDSLRNQQALLA